MKNYPDDDDLEEDVDTEETNEEEYPNLPSRITNPNNEPTGHHTGRCSQCGSNDLWDDDLHYGCNNCGAWLA